MPRTLSETEVVQMLAVADGRDAMVLKCLYFLGLRNGELRALRVGDIDFESGRVSVGRRRVLIPPGFERELQSFIGDRSGAVFEGRSDGTLSDRHIRRIVKKYAALGNVRAAGEVRPYTLKHSHRENV